MPYLLSLQKYLLSYYFYLESKTVLMKGKFPCFYVWVVFNIGLIIKIVLLLISKKRKCIFLKQLFRYLLSIRYYDFKAFK